MDIMIYVAVILAIVVRLVIMKGNFVLPTIYRCDNQMTFNLGSLSTIIIAIVAALGLMYTSPDQFANPMTAFITTYAAPQLVDGVVTFGVRNTMSVEDEEKEESKDYEEVA